MNSSNDDHPTLVNPGHTHNIIMQMLYRKSDQKTYTWATNLILFCNTDVILVILTSSQVCSGHTVFSTSVPVSLQLKDSQGCEESLHWSPTLIHQREKNSYIHCAVYFVLNLVTLRSFKGTSKTILNRQNSHCE